MRDSTKLKFQFFGLKATQQCHKGSLAVQYYTELTKLQKAQPELACSTREYLTAHVTQSGGKGWLSGCLDYHLFTFSSLFTSKKWAHPLLVVVACYLRQGCSHLCTQLPFCF